MSNSVTPASTTAATLIAANPNVVGKLFAEKIRRGSATTQNPWAQWVGKGTNGGTHNGLSGAPVAVVTDLSKGGGMVVHFTVMRGLHTKPVLGEGTLMGNEHGVKLGDYSVRVDYVRNAASISRKTLAAMAAGGDLLPKLAENVDGLNGRQQSDFIWQRLRERTTAGINLLYPNGKSSLSALGSSDTISTDLVDRASRYIRGIGARPITNKKLMNGASVSNFLFVAPTNVLAPLWGDTSYSNASNYADNRGSENVQFSGGFVNWRGQTIYHCDIINEDTTGPIGSYFAPEARLGVAVSAATTAVALKGGGTGYDAAYTPAVDYFRYFPGGSSIGKQSEEETRASDTGDYYIKVIDPTQSNKWAFYKYTGNDNTGTTITTASSAGRLAAASSGTAATTVGNVTWDSSKNIENPAQGSLMFLANSYGHIIGYVAALGSDSVLVAKGGGAGFNQNATYSAAFSSGLKRAVESFIGGASSGSIDDDYGMLLSLSTEAVFGVDCPKNSLGQYNSHLLIPVVYTPPTGSGA